MDINCKNGKILYKYYLDRNIKARDEAKNKLKNRDFKDLYSSHWVDVCRKEVRLNFGGVDAVIQELINIKKKIKPNESDPFLEVYNEDSNKNWFDRDTGYICIVSKLFKIVPLQKCKNIAKYNTSSALWKIKYQPNGKDTKEYLKIIDKLTHQKGA